MAKATINSSFHSITASAEQLDVITASAEQLDVITVSTEQLDVIVVDGIVDERDMYYFGIIGMSAVCAFFILFGVINNIINMAVFIRVGFKDSINISLFALAISDMLSCLTMTPSVIATNPYIGNVDLPINWFHVAHVVGAWPHVAFVKITTLITAFITIERCLCVFMPLKVKAIITRHRVIGYLVSCYLGVGILLSSLFYSNQLGWTYSEALNKSILGLVFVKEREDIEKVVSPIFNACISVFAFVLIIISTIVLVVTLQKKAAWRIGATTVNKNSTEATNNEAVVATKEQRISKMVVMISTVFIASLFPSVILLLLLWADRRFDFSGPYANLFVIIGCVAYILELVNAGMNIFIYYYNSSIYKSAFDQMFRFRSKTK